MQPSLSRPIDGYVDRQNSQLASRTAHSKQAHTKRPAPKAPPSVSPAAGLDTDGNVNDLARIITSEASIGNEPERTSVGFTVLNRMRRNGTSRVQDVQSGYVHNQAPAPWAISLAAKILKSQIADPTRGATHTSTRHVECPKKERVLVAPTFPEAWSKPAA